MSEREFFFVVAPAHPVRASIARWAAADLHSGHRESPAHVVKEHAKKAHIPKGSRARHAGATGR